MTNVKPVIHVELVPLEYAFDLRDDDQVSVRRLTETLTRPRFEDYDDDYRIPGGELDALVTAFVAGFAAHRDFHTLDDDTLGGLVHHMSDILEHESIRDLVVQAGESGGGDAGGSLPVVDLSVIAESEWDPWEKEWALDSDGAHALFPLVWESDELPEVRRYWLGFGQ